MAQATPPTETFGDFLKLVRLYCGLESQQLAAHARVSNATITYYEQGRGTPNPRNLERLTQSLQERLDAKLAAQGQGPVDLWPYTLHLWLVHGGANPSPTPERPPLPRQERQSRPAAPETAQPAGAGRTGCTGVGRDLPARDQTPHRRTDRGSGRVGRCGRAGGDGWLRDYPRPESRRELFCNE